VGDEGCDDGNIEADDGCSDQCVVEAGWTCDGTPSDCEPICGDGLIVGTESCDGSDLAGETCASLGLISGDLACSPACAFDVSGCTGIPECGNDAVEFPEPCDGLDLDGETCVTQGFGGGTLDCAANCTFDVSACDPLPVCGNGAVEAGEHCDGSDLAGHTCLSLGWDSGNLGCQVDCTYDTSDCAGSGPMCGNGLVEGLEACDDSNTDDCDGCRGDCSAVETGCGDGFLCGAEVCDDGNTDDCDGCRGDCSALETGCGDGFVCGAEQCDGLNLDGETCGSLGHDGGGLACTVNCSFDESACIDCPPGLTFCAGAGACVDLLSDNDHCGGCGAPCGAAVCIGGLCQAVAQPWSPVGQNPVGGGALSLLAHDLATDGAQPTVAIVEDIGGGNRLVRVLDHDGVVAWNDLPPSPSGPDWLDEAVSLVYDGATPFVAFGGGSVGPWGAIRVMFYQGGAWQEVGAPGFPSACGMHWFIDLALDGSTPHLTAIGAGGCGIGVDYAWYDGVAWQTHPGPTGFPGQLTMNGQGNPAIVYHNEALIGLADWDPVDGTTIHTVQHWEGGVGAWADVDGLLDMNLESGWEEHIALALDPAADLYTAWVESDGGAPAANDIYVKRHDATAGTWSLVGGGEINGAGSATLPSITVIGTTPWVAYVETANSGVDHVLVRRFDRDTSTWELIGPPLNEDVNENATAPVIVSIGGVPYVAFREEVAGPGSPWQLYVRRFP
jgi:cysteine-rich repeat protein